MAVSSAVRRVQLPEQVAVIASAVCSVAAASGIPSRLGLSADDTATLIFALFALAAAIRGWLQARTSGTRVSAADKVELLQALGVAVPTQLKRDAEQERAQ